MRARSALTGRWEGWGVIGDSSLKPKVAEPSMLGIGRPDRHALPRITLVENAPTTTRAPLPRAGSFIDPKPSLVAGNRNEEKCPQSRRSVREQGTAEPVGVDVPIRAVNPQLSRVMSTAAENQATCRRQSGAVQRSVF
jgi:hypothetical protein